VALGGYLLRDNNRYARGKPNTANPENASQIADGSGTLADGVFIVIV